jgi:hypothetical protein
MARKGTLVMTSVAILVAASTTLPVQLAHAGASRSGEGPDVGTYGALPLRFEPNHGQTDERVKFLARGTGYALFLTSTESVLVLRTPEGAHAAGPSRPSKVLRMKLLSGDAHANIAGREELPGKSHYFKGKDAKKWRTNVPQYARVEYQGVYPGVSLMYYGNQGQLEYDFVVSPGADPSVIRLGFEGAERMHLDAGGNLVLSLPGGEVVQKAPVVYQEVGGARKAVEGRFVLQGETLGFEVGAYANDRPLVIDPVLVYSTYLGGTGHDEGAKIAVDASGNAYVTGFTASTDFPTVGPVQPANGGIPDAFVAKINVDGSALVYSTYLGGTGADGVVAPAPMIILPGSSIAVDGSGNAYVAGITSSIDFPTVNPLQGALAGTADVFLAKLNAEGSALVYSTYLGGSSIDWGRTVAVDASGSAYIAGITISDDFPTASPLQAALGGDVDGFVAKVDPAGASLVYSTYLGGTSTDQAEGLAVDASGNAYVTGSTSSADFPTANPFQPVLAIEDAFVAKLNAAGSTLLYSTYLGGSSDDNGAAIAVDASGSAYVTGYTSSTDFPTVNPLQGVNGGRQDVFVSKLNPDGSALAYSTYLGGTSRAGMFGMPSEIGLGIAVDASGNAHVAGSTNSTDFPTLGPVQFNRGFGFVAKLNGAGSALAYSTYLSGSLLDYPRGIALDPSGDALVTGLTSSLDFPTANPLQAARLGPADAFVTKIADVPATCPIQTALHGVAEEAATLGALWRFRDDVMARSGGGSRYIRLFYRHAGEGARLLAQDARLRAQARALLRRLLPTLRAVTAGRRPAQPPPADLRAIEDLMDALAAKGSPALQATISDLRAEVRSGRSWGILRDWAETSQALKRVSPR